jgi:thioesterase domain-containing protein
VLNESANGVAGWFEYNTDLFNAVTIQSLRARWIDLLQRIVVDPDVQLQDGYAREASSARSPQIDATAPDIATPARAPDIEAEARLLPLWREVLNFPTLTVKDSFFDAGGHSLLAVRLIYEMKQQLRKTFPLTALFDAPTVRRFVELFVRDNRAASDSEMLCVPLRSSGTARPLFCVPGSGGQPFTFLPLLSLLDANQPVYGLRYPEFDPGQLPPLSIEAVAVKFVVAIRRVQPVGPYRLAGYSLGSIVAFEMAQQLQAAGESVELLAFFDGFAPGTAKPRPLWQRLGIHALKVLSSPGKSLAYLSDRVKSLKREAPETPVDTSPVTRELTRDRLAAEAMGRAYRAHRYRGSILLLQAHQRADWHAFLVTRPANGWSELADSVDIVAVPGTHLTLFSDTNVKILAAGLNDRLRKLPA